MSRFIYFLFFLSLLHFLTSCNGQTKPSSIEVQDRKSKLLVGGGCDGCEIMYVGLATNLNSVDTSAAWTEIGKKLLVTGTVYNLDGKSPTANVILYYWQTDNKGLYVPKTGMNEKAKLHGYIRGWVKTDETGRYSIYTIRPAPYPSEEMPAHIHISIKEPNIDNEYYIDDIVFDDDKLLTSEKRNALENRGGSGILTVLNAGDIQIAEHNIILGLNIPHYPTSN